MPALPEAHRGHRAHPWATDSRNTATLFASGQVTADAGTLGEMQAHCSSAGPTLQAAETGRLRKAGLMFHDKSILNRKNATLCHLHFMKGQFILLLERT